MLALSKMTFRPSRPSLPLANRPYTMLKKNDRIEQIKILNDELHPELKCVGDRIGGQIATRFLGALLYPAVGFTGQFPWLMAWGPVCVGTHHIAIHSFYPAARALLQSGEVVKDQIQNKEVVQLINDKKINRFHFTYNGNLILHLDTFSRLSFEHLKGAPLQVEMSIYEHKLNAFMIHSNEANKSKNNKISYFHLNDEVQNQVNKILRARKFRFRAIMGTVMFTSVAGTLTALKQEMMPFFPVFISAGLFQLGNVSFFGVGRHSGDLAEMVRKMNKFTDIIHPKYKHLYPESFELGNCFYVTLLGNIEITRPDIPARDRYILKENNEIQNVVEKWRP